MSQTTDEVKRARRRTTTLVVVLCLVVAAGALVAGVFGLLAPVRATEQALDLPNTPVVEFHTPGGQTGCRLSKDGVRCDVKERTWPAPEAPAECPTKWGNAVQLNGAETVHFVCQEENLSKAGIELPYGQRLVRGDFQCTSREAAVRCLNTKTQHGFSISRTDYTPY